MGFLGPALERGRASIGTRMGDREQIWRRRESLRRQYKELI